MNRHMQRGEIVKDADWYKQIHLRRLEHEGIIDGAEFRRLVRLPLATVYSEYPEGAQRHDYGMYCTCPDCTGEEV